MTAIYIQSRRDMCYNTFVPLVTWIERERWDSLPQAVGFSVAEVWRRLGIPEPSDGWGDPMYRNHDYADEQFFERAMKDENWVYQPAFRANILSVRPDLHLAHPIRPMRGYRPDAWLWSEEYGLCPVEMKPLLFDPGAIRQIEDYMVRFKSKHAYAVAPRLTDGLWGVLMPREIEFIRFDPADIIRNLAKAA